MQLKIPPVAITIVFAVVIWFTNQYFENQLLIFEGYIWLVFGCFLLGAIIGMLGVYEFRKKSTTVDPLAPNKASTVVDSGIYQFSRNPMYLSLLLMLIALVLYLGNPYGFLVLPMFIWYINYFQIEPEEEALIKKFGDLYRKYKCSVRRWI